MNRKQCVSIGVLLGSLFFAAAVLGQESLQTQAEKALRDPNHEITQLFGNDNEDCVPHLMLCGQLVESQLTTRDCKLSDGSHAAAWFFPSYHTQAVGVAVSSPDFNVLTGLADPNGTVRDAAQANAGEIASFGDYLTAHGNYEILVAPNTGSPAKTGAYRIALVCDFSCAADPASLCLLHKRFRVQVAWQNQFNNQVGFGRAIPRTDLTGFFSFGDPSNIELILKILDFGDTIKVFYGELTNLHFSIAVTDMLTGITTNTYSNTPGDCGGIDQNAFESLEAGSLAPRRATAPSGACRTAKGTLCLLSRRFAVSVDWYNPGNGQSGSGSATSLSDLNGSFYFTDPGNVELVIKMIDFGDRIAVFYGALSDLEYTIHVTDTATGAVKTYHNPPGKFCGGLDNSAF